MDSYSLVLWPLVASLTREPGHFPSWARAGHEYRGFSLRRRTEQPCYGQHNRQARFQIFCILRGDYSAHMGRSDIHLLSCTLKNFCNPPGFPFSSEGERFRGHADSGDCVQMWEVVHALRLWSGHAAVPLLLQPCEIESGSWLSPKNPQTVPMLSFDSLHCHLCPHAPPHTFSAVKDLNYQ